MTSTFVPNRMSDIISTGVVDVTKEGATGDGVTDDSPSFISAYDKLPANGGTILVPPPSVSYLINNKLSYTTKPVRMIGMAGATSDPNASTSRGVILKSGVAGDTCIEILGGNVGSIDYLRTGCWFENLIIDCAGISTHGIWADRWRYGGGKNLVILNPTLTCMELTTSGPIMHDETMYNNFNYLVLKGPMGLHLNTASPTLNNCAHNVFQNIEIDYTGAYGMKLYGDDNNVFFHTRMFRRAGNGYAVGLLTTSAGGGYCSRDNSFYHIQPQGGVFSDCMYPSHMYHYSRGNGEPAPTLSGAGKLIWTESGMGNGWQFPFMTYSTGNKPLASSVKAGTVIFVSNGGAGNVFQGSNGVNWVSLG